MKLRKSVVFSATLSLFFLGLPVTAFSSSLTTLERAKTSQLHSDKLVRVMQQEVSTIVAGLQNFYVDNAGAWPSSLNSISPYYHGEFKTPFGVVRGSQTQTGYQLIVNANNADKQTMLKLKSMVSKHRGSVSGSVITFNIQPPSQSAATVGVISRFADLESGERNRMHTNLKMNSFDIHNIKEMNAQALMISNAEISSASIHAANIDDVLVDTLNANSLSVNNLTVGSANYHDLKAGILSAGKVDVSGLVKTSKILSRGVLVASGDGRVHYEGEDVDKRYLGVLDTAKDSEMLGGIESSYYVRTDSVNTFTEKQIFDGGMTVVGELNAGNIDTKKMNVSGDIKARHVHGIQNVMIGTSYIGSTVQQQNQNNNDISHLNTLIPPGALLGQW